MTPTPIKQIAVVLAGPNEEYQGSLLRGMIAAAKAANANLAVFATFGGVLKNSQDDIGEYNIYSLMNLKKFDGIIMLNNTIGSDAVCAEILKKVQAAGIPAAVFDSNVDPAFYNICIDNRSAMYEIVQHVVREHGAKNINYISGPLTNPEAVTRYETFLSVLAENGLTADARRIFFGEFRPEDGIRAAEEMLASDLPLPDALISANDAMALEAIETLEAHGIRVPEDMIVTGFDDIYYARYHAPALTTVTRPLFEAGRIACETILRVLEGEECRKTITLNAEPVYRGSCGCKSAQAADYMSYQKSTYTMLKRNRSDVFMLNRITSALAEAESKEEHFRMLSQFIRELECDRCCVCLCEDWQNTFREPKAEKGKCYQIHGYTTKMSAPLIWDHGKVSDLDSFYSMNMYPVPPQDGGNVSYFLPLHFRERCLGYYIITNSDFPYRSLLCHSVMMNLGHSLENIRKLLNLNNAIRELDRLYVIDPMCNIYNRNGFIRLADQMFRHCEQTGETLMITFIDMDGLKLINDNFGHDEGDFALQRLAAVIGDICFRNMVCARFGGDEFIAIGTDLTEADAEIFEQNFRTHLAEMNRIIHKPYELSASVGTFVSKVTSDMKLFSLISQADQIMYEQKKKKRTSRYLRKD
ncbi:MAG TPA: arabinogalactan endo-1,4-beta-galactosidase [Ruminococcus sp.]|nr:arabinogalactan endo-1,4-beta-galactosidase [Ruminococcus sp.]